MKITSAGTKRTPPPTPSRPPTMPPAKPRIAAAISLTARSARSRSRPGAAAKSTEMRRSGMRCWRAVPTKAPAIAGTTHECGVRRVDVSVERLERDRDGRDHHDRHHARAGGLSRPVAQPDDQQRDDHAAAADPEQAAEDAAGRPDRRQLQVVRGRRGVSAWRAILERVTGGSAEDDVDTRRSTPDRAAPRAAGSLRDPHRRRRDDRADRRATPREAAVPEETREPAPRAGRSATPWSAA